MLAVFVLKCFEGDTYVQSLCIVRCGLWGDGKLCDERLCVNSDKIMRELGEAAGRELKYKWAESQISCRLMVRGMPI